MNKKFCVFILLSLILATFTMAIPSKKIMVNLNSSNNSYGDNLHVVLGEYATNTNIEHKYSLIELERIYKNGYHPFVFTTLVCDKNIHAYQRAVNELCLLEYPTLFLDGGYLNIVGDENYTEYNESILACKNREVADIDISLDIEWLGAVNPNPPHGATNVSSWGVSWDNCAMNIDCVVGNNELNQYDGHLHVYVVENSSSYWNDTYSLPYVFAFLDYAWNDYIQIDAGDTWEDSKEWDGADYNNGDEENLTVFNDIKQDNTRIIASVFSDDTKYTDESSSLIAGVGTDPKMFDVYFGNTTPPPKVISNYSGKSYTPGCIEWNTTYFWRVDVIDNQGKVINGTIWNFTTRNNHPPYTPTDPFPPNGSINITTNYLHWNGGDPDNDTVYYDVYFGPELPPDKISANQTNNWFNLTDVNFNTSYYWKINAWDRWDYSSKGPLWHFTTAENFPPYPPYDLKPLNGSITPLDINLTWSGGDPNEWDLVFYDIYFGEDSDPKLLDRIGPYYATQMNISFGLPFDLEIFKKYYWKIVATDSQELSSESYIHSFTTGNFPPNAPIVTGKKIGRAGKDYEYKFVTDDHESEDISYRIDWGDGNNSGWLGPYSSGEEITLVHSWSKGTYTITAWAKDHPYEQEGNLSKFVVSMPKFYRFWVVNWLEKFPIFQWLLRWFFL